ncbi:unnamed protein product [Diamesa serratosioi]
MLQTCKLPNNLAKDAVLAWELRNKHEDIEELVLSLSLNEGLEAPDEKSNDSDSDESSVSHASPPDTAFNGTNQKENLPGNDTLNKDKKPADVVASERRYVMFGGSMVRKGFQVANLDIEIMSKDLIIQEIQFIRDLQTPDKEFEFGIYELVEHDLRYKFNDKVSIENEKLNGQYQYIRYILPKNKNITLKADRKYHFHVRFQQDEIRSTYDNYVADSSCVDRFKLIHDEPLKTYPKTIASLTFVDA